MPDVQSQILFTFEILDATLADFRRVDTTQHADLIEACGSLLYGSKEAEVQAQLSGSIGRPTIPVSARGVPELEACWDRVLAAIEAYNAIDTGLQLDPGSCGASPLPRPHCAEWAWVDGEMVLVLNWLVQLTTGGRTDPLFRASDVASVDLQVMAMGHAAIKIPVESAP